MNSRKHLIRSITGTVLALALAGLASTKANAATAPSYHYRLSNHFQYQSDASGSDARFRPYFSFYGYNLQDGHLDLRLAGAYEFDLNSQDAFERANDQSWPRIHQAAVDLHDYGALSHLIIGRQYLPQVDYLHFDGLTLQLWDDRQVSVFGFGGRPVSHYSSNSGEWLAGAGVRLRPWPSTQLQMDVYGLEDLGEDAIASALRLSQYWPCGFADTLEARWIDGTFRDLTLRLFYATPTNFDITGLIHWQAARLGEDAETRNSRDFSLFSGFMGAAEENLLFRLDANLYLGEHYTVSAGASHRQILDRDHAGGENWTNIDSTRLTAGISVIDLPIERLSFELFGSYYQQPEEDFWDITGELGYTFTPKFSASCGVTRALYDYAQFLFFVDRFGQPVPDETGGKDGSSTIFLNARYQLSENWRLSAWADYEDVDSLSEDAYTLGFTVQYSWWHRPAGTP